MSHFDPDYDVASTKAREFADQCKMLVRLRKVNGPLEKGYVWNMVPSLAMQFGPADLEGELIVPTGMDDPRGSRKTNPAGVG